MKVCCLTLFRSFRLKTVQTFQQDNATPHRARIALQFLEEHEVPTLPWPARSPGLSPIEHAWDLLGRRMREVYEAPP